MSTGKNRISIALAAIMAGAIAFMAVSGCSPSVDEEPRIAASVKKAPSPPPIPDFHNQTEAVIDALSREGLVRKTGTDREFYLTEYSKAFRKKAAEIARQQSPDLSVDFGDNAIRFSRGTEVLEYSLYFPPRPPRREGLPRLAIIIDDVGNSLEAGEELLTMRGLTLSIIPGLKYSTYFAEKGHKLGREIMVHMPMEPKDTDKYGNGSDLLRVAMSDEEIAKRTEQFIAAVPRATGANNHMGSRFTEDGAKMKVVMNVLKQKHLFFLDSRTSASSRAFSEADSAGVPNLKRDIFLDHEISESVISAQLDLAVKMAEKNGQAVAIGHPHPQTIKVLKKRLGEISSRVELVPASRLLP